MIWFRSRYRIVRDSDCGYEVQVKKWWFPFLYFQCWRTGMINTFVTVEKARLYTKEHRKMGYVVEYIKEET